MTTTPSHQVEMESSSSCPAVASSPQIPQDKERKEKKRCSAARPTGSNLDMFLISLADVTNLLARQLRLTSRCRLHASATSSFGAQQALGTLRSIKEAINNQTTRIAESLESLDPGIDLMRK